MRKFFLLTAFTLAAAVSAAPAAHAQLIETRMISLDAAKQMMAAAEAEAQRNNWNVAIAIVDAGGELIQLNRRDGTQAASVDIAIGKARTAVRFRRPSKAVEDIILGGRVTLMTAGGGIVPVEGGLPIVHDGQVIGGIGVSGVTAAQDEQIAAAGVAALRP
jgi:glc operon protein GlcG